MSSNWVSVDTLTGNLRADLPLLDGQDGLLTLSQTIGMYETVNVALPIDRLDAVPEWTRATLPYGSALVLLDDNPNDPTHGIPVWGGIVNQRVRDQSDAVALSLITAEGYLDRRFVGNVSFTGIGQNEIVSSLISAYVQIGPNGGIPMRVQLLAGLDPLITQAFADQDDKTVYSILTTMMSSPGGVEWTVGWEWQTAPERLTPVIYIGARIGTAVGAGMSPNATFDMPGPDANFQHIEDYSDGKGANSVVATGPGSGTTRPQSPAATVADVNRPTVEFRYSPSTTVQDVPTLTTLATSAVAALAPGANALTMTADLYTGPRLGIDWFIGDDVGYNIGGLDANGNDTVPSEPGGFSGVARAIGWQRTLGMTPQMTPILAVPKAY